MDDSRSDPSPPIDKIAWVHIENHTILSTRSRGKDVYYIPGGKREDAETDLETLVREVREELDVAILADTATHLGTFEAQADGHNSGVIVRMAYRGSATEMTTRSRAELRALLSGLELVEPGLVDVTDWPDARPDVPAIGVYAAVATVPVPATS